MIFHPFVFIYLPRKSEFLSLSHTHTHTHTHTLCLFLNRNDFTYQIENKVKPFLKNFQTFFFRQFIFHKLMIAISKIRKRFGPFSMEFIWQYLHLMNLVKLHFVHYSVHKILNGLNPKARLL